MESGSYIQRNGIKSNQIVDAVTWTMDLPTSIICGLPSVEVVRRRRCAAAQGHIPKHSLFWCLMKVVQTAMLGRVRKQTGLACSTVHFDLDPVEGGIWFCQLFTGRRPKDGFEEL
jgi:hypothetical protein